MDNTAFTNSIKSVPRILMEAKLRPVQGDRFQSTGFPHLGPALYELHDGTRKLLVESAQSVANRLEGAILNPSSITLLDELKGLPYLSVHIKGQNELTNSLVESHRINSEYIAKDSQFRNTFTTEIGLEKNQPINFRLLYSTLFKYDLNSLIHGCFLEEMDGRLRITRAISGFIEADEVREVESGGSKHNRVQPTLKEGEGNLTYPRVEFTAPKMTAFFNLDLLLLRSYGLPESAYALLTSVAFLKVVRFLNYGLRLRSACDLEIDGELIVTRPTDFTLPSEESLLKLVKIGIEACREEKLFADPPVTEIEYTPSKKKDKQKGKASAASPESAEDQESEDSFQGSFERE